MKELLKRFVLIAAAAIAAFSLTAAAAVSDWAKAEFEQAAELGLLPESMTGADAENTAPITRAEFCSLMAKVIDSWEADGNECTPIEGTASDIAFDDTSDESVMLCSGLGIVSGDGAGSFFPDRTITRAEAAKMLSNTYRVMTGSGIEVSAALPHVFEDGESLRAWAREHVCFVYRTGVMAGVGGNRFDADGTYTREQAALTALRLFRLCGGETLETAPAPEYFPNAEAIYGTSPVEYWFSSSLEKAPASELGRVYPYGAEYAAIVDNIGAGVSSMHIIDREGNTVLSDFKDSGGSFYSASVEGSLARVIVSPGGDEYVVDIESGAVISQGSPAAEQVPEHSEIRMENGFYTLTDESGRELSETYANALIPFGGGVYAGYIENDRYQYIYCDGKSPARVLFEDSTVGGRPHVATDGHGTYAVQTSVSTIRVFDIYGDTIGTIDLNPDGEYLIFGVRFVGGLIWESHTGAYYLPTGEKVVLPD